MSEVANILSASISDRSVGTADNIVNLATGAVFTAEVEVNLDPLTLPVQFIDDPRQKIRLHVTDYAQASGITKGNQIQFAFNGRATKFEIIHGFADPAAFQSIFLAIHLVAGLN